LREAGCTLTRLGLDGLATLTPPSRRG